MEAFLALIIEKLVESALGKLWASFQQWRADQAKEKQYDKNVSEAKTTYVAVIKTPTSTPQEQEDAFANLINTARRH